MGNLELIFKLEGEKQMIRRLVGISRDLQDWTPQFQRTGDMLLKTFRMNFASEGGELGEPWPPLSPKTLAEKRRLGYPPDTLVRTGRMRSSFASTPSRYAVVITNPSPYFAYHQSRGPRAKIPRRVMMKIDEKRRQTIAKIFQEAVERTLMERWRN